MICSAVTFDFPAKCHGLFGDPPDQERSGPYQIRIRNTAYTANKIRFVYSKK